MTSQSPPIILSTASAYGTHYSTEEMIQALIRNRKDDPTFDEDFARKVFDKCGFKQHSVALTDPDDLFRRFTRREYLAHRNTNLVGLAERAGREALLGWGRPSSEITHLLWGTMTGGMHSPSIDVKLVGRLGLSSDVGRTNIEGMGCLTGFRLLNIAREIAHADSNARILVISADLRSALGNSLPEHSTRQDIVSVALFRDAASACVVGATSATLRDGEQPRYEIITGLSRVVNDTHEAVDYYEDDDGGIRLHLSRDLPTMIGRHDVDFVQSLLKKGRAAGHNIPSLTSNHFDLLCHTGGPKILLEVQRSLNLEKRDLMWSWDVMEANGNLSGASNLAVLDWHNRLYHHEDDSVGKQKSEFSIGLSMGPGPTLESVLLRCLHTSVDKDTSPTYFPHHQSDDGSLVNPVREREEVHIIGGGIAGMTLAAGLDPRLFRVKIFEASPLVEEKGYGLAIWGSTFDILKHKLGITDLDYFSAKAMVVRGESSMKRIIPLNNGGGDKGFMQRRLLLEKLKQKALDQHPEALHKNHKCVRLRLGSGREGITASYLVNSELLSHRCDLLIGADGVNSVVRNYIALQKNSKEYGHMTAYRFTVRNPSKSLLEDTKEKWNMSIGGHIHSPCYHVSRDDSTLSIAVLEYDGKTPGVPRPASVDELASVAERSKLSFIQKIINDEEICDLMCYSTFHIDCKPWHNSSAAIIGDAAHAYGPLTAKMANLAINDAYTLSVMLNDGLKSMKRREDVLREWEEVQRPKFSTTRIRTLRHLQLYSPRWRRVTEFLWRYFPSCMLKYFGSIFAYDYEVYDATKENHSSFVPGIAGITHEDPLVSFVNEGLKYLFLILTLIGICSLLLHNTK